MTPHEKYSALKSLEAAWEEINKIKTETPCRDCTNYSMEGGGFGNDLCLKWNQVIPKDILPVGCDAFTFDPNSPPF